MPINWDSVKENAGGNFLPYANAGTHKVKIGTIDVRETKNAQGSTSYWLDLLPEDTEVKYPKLSHPISFKNQNWRLWHFMNILKELGIAEEKAKAGIEQAESKKGEANIVAAYHAMFDRATQKHPEVEIEVYEDTNLNPNTGRPYMRADFKNPAISFGRDNRTQAPAKEESILDSGEEISLDQDDLSVPF